METPLPLPFEFAVVNLQELDNLGPPRMNIRIVPITTLAFMRPDPIPDGKQCGTITQVRLPPGREELIDKKAQEYVLRKSCDKRP